MNYLASTEAAPSEALGGIIIFLLIYVALPAMILVGTWVIGRVIERNHLFEIGKREARLANIPAVTSKTLPGLPPVESSKMVTGSVVISVDHFKRWLTSFRTIFGGEMKSYVSVIERGRREAILRMKESSPDADLFLNCRLETSTISNGKGKAVGCAEVLAYATAVRFKK